VERRCYPGLSAVDYHGERRDLAKPRKAAFAEPPVSRTNLSAGFSEYETTTAGSGAWPESPTYFTKYTQ